MPSQFSVPSSAVMRSLVLLLGLLLGCASPQARPAQERATRSEPAAVPTAATSPARADVTAVSASGAPGAYELAVTIASPDRGCEQYASWWEVISPEGQLLYRRILGHSHVDEQPFTRSGGPAPIAADERVIVRAHMAPGGYGGGAMQGSVSAGFTPVDLATDFAAALAERDPLPDGCAF